MRERTNTSGYSLLPEGHYVFTVDGVPEKKPTKDGKGSFRIWKFTYRDMGRDMKFQTVILPSQSKDLLLALGGSEDGDYVEWDPDLVDGLSFVCDVIHEPDNNGKVRERLINIKQHGQGQISTAAENQEDSPVHWDE